VTDRIAGQIRHDTQSATESNALSKLRESAEVAVPETLVERQVKAMKEEEAEQIKKQFNVSMEEYLEKNGITPETFEQSIKERAERTVRQTLVLEALADERSVEVNEQDIDIEIKSLSEYLKSDPDRIRSLLLKDRERMTDFLHRIRMNKAIALLMSEITVKEVPVGTSTEGVESPAESKPE
jgi:FKBP-type peptidyl-prolyl cis-trans isomerase (trigger factor)